jgi:hypothetical protein
MHPRLLERMHSTGGVSLVSPATIVFDTVRNADSSFSHSGVTGETSFNVTGKFQVTYEVTIEQPTGNNRTGVKFNAQVGSIQDKHHKVKVLPQYRLLYLLPLVTRFES